MKTSQLLKTVVDYGVIRPLLCAALILPPGVPLVVYAEPLPGPAAKARPLPPSFHAPAFDGRPVDQLRASATPTDQEIFVARVFDEPLIPIGGATRPAENKALAEALLAYADRTNPDDFSSLTKFLRAFPDSAWRPSLLLHLGTEYYNHGYYAKALDAWEQGWNAAEPVRSGPAKPQADRLLGELARMYSKVGRMGELARLLRSTADRDLEGPATQLIGAAKGALWMMENKPDFCFKCGPLALDRIVRRHKPEKAGHAAILDARSGTNGFSLVEVAKLSGVTEMNYQMAYRSPGARFVVPAVVHWKIGHFAAVVEREEGGGRLLAQDDTFGNSVWITPAALESEGSGYFLIPRGPLPPGWRAVPEEEGRQVWGKGFVDGAHPNATTRYDHTCRPCDVKDKIISAITPDSGPDYQASAAARGLADYDMHALLASLIVNDTPVGYNPPVGPAVQFTASYHQREANQPATFSYSNLGPKWTCNWVSYITDNPSSPNADVKLYVDGGGTLDFTSFNPGTQSYKVEAMSQAKLIKLGAPESYELQYPDGSRRQFTRSDGSVGSTRRVFLTQVIDPAGNAVELNYDAQLRITNIVDTIGQATGWFYTNAAYPHAVTSVLDPFGRSAHFEYNASGLLIQITDAIGLVSQFAYGANQFMTNLTTPYGTTTFTTGTVPGGGNGTAFVQATDPLGQSERVEFYQAGLPHYLPNPEVPRGLATFNRFIDGRNSFYWDKKAYAEAPGDYTRAKNFHWVHLVVTSAGPMAETIKDPLEGRVWYNYPGQPTNFGAPYYLNSAYAGTLNKPNIVARILDDGTTQLASYEYNALGNVTKSIDPVGRTFTYVYSTNNVDLLEVRMTRNGSNELLRRTTYNAQHLPLSVTDVAGQSTTNTYNARGQITSTRNPLGEITTYTYDPNGYLIAMNGPLAGATNDLTLTYDAAGRVHTMTLPQGYTLTYGYDALDRRTQVTYPDGSYEQFVYERLDLAAVRDRLGNWSTNTYNAIGQLVETRDPLGRISRYTWCHCGSPESFTDAMGRTTTWTYDLRGRVRAKTYPDGSTISYEYEDARGLLKRKRDEQGQLTVYEYYPDNNLKQVTYLDTAVPTPGVFFTYDPDYDRILTRQDGAGLTQYVYNPIDAVPILGAGALQSISGPLPNSMVSYQYDALGRVVNRSINGVAESRGYDVLGRATTVSNALGAFHYSYVDLTRAPASEAYPNGQTNLYTYQGNAGDRRLKQITYLKPNGSVLSSASYVYNSSGQLTLLTNEWDALPSGVWSFQYDNAGQLTAASRTDGGTNVATYNYAYDAAGNRLVAAVNGTTNEFEYNALNQVVSGDAAPTNGVTYEWDGANRLTAINQGSRRSEFSYDGLGRRVRIVEKTNSVVASDTRFLWCEGQICEARDAGGTNVLRRFFNQGEVIIGSGTTNLFYARGPLNTVREATDSGGNLKARFDYEPYGRQIELVAEIHPSFAFTGHFQHRPSGLYLPLHRALDPGLGRWLSRDPIAEEGGANLYRYVLNDPVNLMDPTGELPHCLVVGILAGGATAIAGLFTAAFTDKPLFTTRAGAYAAIGGAALVAGGVCVAATAIAAAGPAGAPIAIKVGEVIVRYAGRITTRCP